MDARTVARRQEVIYYTDSFREANRPFLDQFFDLVQAAPTPAHAVKGHLAAIGAFDGSQNMVKIAAPTLVITGDSDRLMLPENSVVLSESIPDAKLVTIQDAAHFFWIEKPAESAQALIDFLGPLN